MSTAIRLVRFASRTFGCIILPLSSGILGCFKFSCQKNFSLFTVWSVQPTPLAVAAVLAADTDGMKSAYPAEALAACTGMGLSAGAYTVPSTADCSR
ncbi:MAG: hypothetical protein J7L99_02645 [Planctomycetes bacterium]|nr:hypothetical protein [Planctomycetota bacterium]